MIVQTSELIDQLVFIANGNFDLVEQAIIASAGDDDRADLKDVVAYIVRMSNGWTHEIAENQN